MELLLFVPVLSLAIEFNNKEAVDMGYANRAAGFEHKKPLDDNPYGDFFQRYSYVDFLDDNLVDK